jgi:hypothetical protein
MTIRIELPGVKLGVVEADGVRFALVDERLSKLMEEVCKRKRREFTIESLAEAEPPLSLGLANVSHSLPQPVQPAAPSAARPAKRSPPAALHISPYVRSRRIGYPVKLRLRFRCPNLSSSF